MLLARESDVELATTYFDYHLSGLAEIYQESVNLCVWQRELSEDLIRYSAELIKNKHWSMRTVVDINEIYNEVYAGLPKFDDENGREALAKDVTSIATLFADLFELDGVGIRLSVLDNTMCPRFHTDNLPCRLVTTYSGKGTEWLPEYALVRSKLGHVSSGIADKDSGIYLNASDIQQLTAGDVALMKGAGWNDYQHPIVHRSPEIASDENRLILTLDFAN